MEHKPNSKTYTIFCHEHKPLPADSELYFQFWDRIDTAGVFIEQYADFQRKHSDLIRQSMSAQERETWRPHEKASLFN